jgi:hypothetical protein
MVRDRSGTVLRRGTTGLGPLELRFGILYAVGIEILGECAPSAAQRVIDCGLCRPREIEDKEIEGILRGAGLQVQSQRIGFETDGGTRRVCLWNVQWTGKHENREPPPVIRKLASYPHIEKMNFLVS